MLVIGGRTHMKKAALLILFIFSMVQLVPGLMTLVQKQDQISLFTPDEEKGDSKGIEEIKKEKKESAFSFNSSALLTRKLNNIFQHRVQLIPAPYLEQPTPPPNC